MVMACPATLPTWLKLIHLEPREGMACTWKILSGGLSAKNLRNILLPSSASIALGKPHASYRGIVLAHPSAFTSLEQQMLPSTASLGLVTYVIARLLCFLKWVD